MVAKVQIHYVVRPPANTLICWTLLLLLRGLPSIQSTVGKERACVGGAKGRASTCLDCPPLRPVLTPLPANGTATPTCPLPPPKRPKRPRTKDPEPTRTNNVPSNWGPRQTRKNRNGQQWGRGSLGRVANGKRCGRYGKQTNDFRIAKTRYQPHYDCLFQALPGLTFSCL